MNESNRTAFKVLEKNLERYKEKIGLDEQQVVLSNRPFGLFLQQWSERSEDVVVYLDPPYEKHALYQEFWQAMHGFQGEVWVESDELKGVKLIDQRQQLNEVIKEVTQGSHWMLVGRAIAGRWILPSLHLKHEDRPLRWHLWSLH